jgi:alginate O-acetyltransferase complex protein AlgI
MLFNSFSFLIFFPLVTVIYFLLPQRLRWIHLLLASCIFYCFFIPAYILILVVTILIDYTAGIYIEKTTGARRRNWLLLSIISTCLVLFVFKYFNFFNSNLVAIAKFLNLKYPIQFINIILPIGLSFHTFQSLSYVVEVYRGNQKAEKHFGIYSLYVMFYPQLVAGPIERPQHMLPQFREIHQFNYNDTTEGLKRIAWGLFKKVVIADRLASYVNPVYDNFGQHNGTSLLLATLFFAFQIYCDFSGYSDIAIGTARVMGFRLIENFNRPYFSKSISEFWKRWHISLSSWFRDYVYIPLGGNRVPKPRQYFNLMVTFVASGFWHGANWTFIVWGALNGIYLVLAQFFIIPLQLIRNLFYQYKLKSVLNILNVGITFVLISISWIFFRAKDVQAAGTILRKIFTDHGPLFVGDNKTMIYSVSFLGILLLSEFFEEYGIYEGYGLLRNRRVLVRRLAYACLVITILLFGVFDSSQFIYFQF